MLLLRRLAGATHRRGLAAQGLSSVAPREATDTVGPWWRAQVSSASRWRVLAMAGHEVVVVEAAITARRSDAGKLRVPSHTDRLRSSPALSVLRQADGEKI